MASEKEILADTNISEAVSRNQSELDTQKTHEPLLEHMESLKSLEIESMAHISSAIAMERNYTAMLHSRQRQMHDIKPSKPPDVIPGAEKDFLEIQNHLLHAQETSAKKLCHAKKMLEYVDSVLRNQMAHFQSNEKSPAQHCDKANPSSHVLKTPKSASNTEHEEQKQICGDVEATAFSSLSSLAGDVNASYWLSEHTKPLRDIKECTNAWKQQTKQTFCLCGRPPTSSMILCKNPNCSDGTWFHLECVGLKEKLPSNQLWYCPICRRMSDFKLKHGTMKLPKTVSLSASTMSTTVHGTAASQVATSAYPIHNSVFETMIGPSTSHSERVQSGVMTSKSIPSIPLHTTQQISASQGNNTLTNIPKRNVMNATMPSLPVRTDGREVHPAKRYRMPMMNQQDKFHRQFGPDVFPNTGNFASTTSIGLANVHRSTNQQILSNPSVVDAPASLTQPMAITTNRRSAAYMNSTTDMQMQLQKQQQLLRTQQLQQQQRIQQLRPQQGTQQLQQQQQHHRQHQLQQHHRQHLQQQHLQQLPQQAQDASNTSGNISYVRNPASSGPMMRAQGIHSQGPFSMENTAGMHASDGQLKSNEWNNFEESNSSILHPNEAFGSIESTENFDWNTAGFPSQYNPATQAMTNAYVRPPTGQYRQDSLYPMADSSLHHPSSIPLESMNMVSSVPLESVNMVSSIPLNSVNMASSHSISIQSQSHAMSIPSIVEIPSSSMFPSQNSPLVASDAYNKSHIPTMTPPILAPPIGNSDNLQQYGDYRRLQTTASGPANAGKITRTEPLYSAQSTFSHTVPCANTNIPSSFPTDSGYPAEFAFSSSFPNDQDLEDDDVPDDSQIPPDKYSDVYPNEFMFDF